jgi:hypothetical protein
VQSAKKRWRFGDPVPTKRSTPILFESLLLLCWERCGKKWAAFVVILPRLRRLQKVEVNTYMFIVKASVRFRAVAMAIDKLKLKPMIEVMILLMAIDKLKLKPMIQVTILLMAVKAINFDFNFNFKAGFKVLGKIEVVLKKNIISPVH